MSDREPTKTSWWHSTPVVMSAIAGLLTAISGLVVGLHQAGILKSGGERSPVVEATAGPSRDPAAASAPSAAASAVAVAAPQTFTNLLSPQYGGRLVAAPNKEWSAANDGELRNPSFLGSGPGAVFGFKDDKPQSFDRFGVLISESGGTPASIEIATSDSLSGPFQPVAEVHPLDLRVIDTDGWQYFDLPRTSARYVRITPTLTPGGGGVFLWEMRLESRS